VIGLDTNVLVRHLVADDDAEQHGAVEKLLAAATATRPAYVSLVALIETVWVLSRGYAYPRKDVLDFVGELLHAPEIVVEQELLVAAALDVARAQPVDFADIVIARSGLRAGCATTYTFDRKAARLAEMSLLAADGTGSGVADPNPA
jgi:predicted nucleic-acid-binding protein